MSFVLVGDLEGTIRARIRNRAVTCDNAEVHVVTANEACPNPSTKSRWVITRF